MFGRNLGPMMKERQDEDLLETGESQVLNPSPNAQEMIEFNKVQNAPVQREQLVPEDNKTQNALAKMFMGLGNAGAISQGVQSNNFAPIQNAILDKMNQDQKDSRNEKFKRIKDILGVK